MAETRPLLRNGLVFHVPAVPPPPCGYSGGDVLPWRYSDGGFGPRGNPCAARAIANATRLDPEAVDRRLELAYLHEVGFRDAPFIETGIPLAVIDRTLRPLGWSYTRIRLTSEPCVAHLSDLPRGEKLIVACNTHMTVLDEGVVVDKGNPSDPAFHVCQCVCGFFRRGEP